MAHILIKQTVTDYVDWRRIFDGQEKTLQAAGRLATQVFRNASDPYEVVLLHEWDGVENAKNFIQSDTFKELNERAGVEDMSDVLFLARE